VENKCGYKFAYKTLFLGTLHWKIHVATVGTTAAHGWVKMHTFVSLNVHYAHVMIGWLTLALWSPLASTIKYIRELNLVANRQSLQTKKKPNKHIAQLF